MRFIISSSIVLIAFDANKIRRIKRASENVDGNFVTVGENLTFSYNELIRLATIVNKNVKFQVHLYQI
jgi:hypothetical protein